MYDPDDAGELDRFALYDPGKRYTRNLIATDHETFTLMLLCWNPGAESPIHDHPCDGCWARVVRGTVVETRYHRDASGAALVESGVASASAGDVMYIDDSIALHKIGNPSPTVPAATLHLYSPPFSRCCIWLNQADAHAVLKPTVTYYSEGGEVLDYERVAAPPGGGTGSLCG
jgi:cysteine dioxygenase